MQGMGRLIEAPSAMVSNAGVETPELEQLQLDCTSRGEWIVTVFDNDFNTYAEVMTVLMIATQCSPEEAHIETWEVDHLGKSVVHQAHEDECHQVAATIATIGIRVEVSTDS